MSILKIKKKRKIMAKLHLTDPKAKEQEKTGQMPDNYEVVWLESNGNEIEEKKKSFSSKEKFLEFYEELCCNDNFLQVNYMHEPSLVDSVDQPSTDYKEIKENRRLNENKQLLKEQFTGIVVQVLNSKSDKFERTLSKFKLHENIDAVSIGDFFTTYHLTELTTKEVNLIGVEVDRLNENNFNLKESSHRNPKKTIDGDRKIDLWGVDFINPGYDNESGYIVAEIDGEEYTIYIKTFEINNDSYVDIVDEDSIEIAIHDDADEEVDIELSKNDYKALIDAVHTLLTNEVEKDAEGWLRSHVYRYNQEPDWYDYHKDSNL